MVGVMRKAKAPGSKTGARAKAVGTKRKAKVAGTKRKAKEVQVSRQVMTTTGITDKQKVAREANPSTAKGQKERVILLTAKARAKLSHTLLYPHLFSLAYM